MGTNPAPFPGCGRHRAFRRLTPETIKARTFEVLRQLSFSGSKRRTLIFGVEDLHWIDKISEEYLASLVESLSGCGSCCSRPIDQAIGRLGSRSPLPLRCRCGRCPPQIACGLSVRSDGSHGLPSRLLMIVEKAEGNPLFLEELARRCR